MLRKSLSIISGLSILFINSVCGAVDFEGWDIQADNSGKGTKMVIIHPKTPLGIENQLSINIDKTGKVTSGDVQLESNVQRPMGQMEAETYWIELQGQHAFWDYLETQGALTTIETNGLIPSNWVGKPTRVVTLAGNEMYGAIIIPGTSEQDSQLMVENAAVSRIHFTMSAVKKVQIIN